METVGILGRQSRQWTPSLFGIRITSAGPTEGLGTALQRERTQQLCSHGPVGGYRVWTSGLMVGAGGRDAKCWGKQVD